MGRSRCEATRGCTRYRRSKSKYCARHHRELQGAPWRAAPPQQASPATPQRQAGLIASLDTDGDFPRHRELRDGVVRLVSDNQEDLRSRVRKVLELEERDMEWLGPLMEELSRLGCRHIPGLQEPAVLEPAVIVAPPVSNRSSGHAKGPIHEDVEHDCPGYYSFHYFVDAVTLANGAIAIWPTSAEVSRPQGCHKGAPRGHSVEKLTGPPGRLWLHDSRMLHQSLPNSTDQRRVTLSWTVCEKGMEGEIVYKK